MSGATFEKNASRVSVTSLLDITNLAGIVLMETDAVRAMRNVSPAHLIFNRNNGEVSDEIRISKTLAVTWNSFLEVV